MSLEEDISSETKNLIAQCSAGIGLRLEGALQAEVEKLAVSGSLSASAEQEIRGAIFAGADLSDAETQEAFNSYIDCVTGKKQVAEYVELLELKRERILAKLTKLNVDEVNIAEIDSLIARHIDATKNGNVILAHELHTQINAEIVTAFMSAAEGSASLELYSP